jgi:hypothetical protein
VLADWRFEWREYLVETSVQIHTHLEDNIRNAVGGVLGFPKRLLHPNGIAAVLNVLFICLATLVLIDVPSV